MKFEITFYTEVLCVQVDAPDKLMAMQKAHKLGDVQDLFESLDDDEELKVEILEVPD